MSNYKLRGDYKSKSGEVKVNLFLLHFKDENSVHFIYSPHLDLTGYGVNLKEAKKSFEIAFEDFFEYTLENETLEKVLRKLGWEPDSKETNQNKILAPTISSIIGKNEFVSEIFDKYEVKTFHQEFEFPELV